MCGILCICDGVSVISPGILGVGSGDARQDAAASTGLPPQAADFQEGLSSRGPDSQGHVDLSYGTFSLHFQGTLLQLRGKEPAANPLVHAASGSVLVWAGEIFGGYLPVPDGLNDGQCLLQALVECGKGDTNVGGVPGVLSRIRGPWAVVFWDAGTHTLWFGRDILGGLPMRGTFLSCSQHSCLIHVLFAHHTPCLVVCASWLQAAAACSFPPQPLQTGA
jgi:asparagine synthetase B (glutamine-hydrolysing)